MSQTKCRYFEVILYPDSEDYDCTDILEKAQSYFEHWAWAYHYADVNKDGTPKKRHIHFYGKFTNARSLSTIANTLGVKENHIQFVHNWIKAIRYSVHADDPNKHQYSWDEVNTNLNLDLFKSDSQPDYDEQIRIILDIIPLCTNTYDLVKLASDKRCSAMLLKGSYLWGRIIDKK